MKKKIISVIGARPQFIKHAPLQVELGKHFNSLTIHTGQHYDHSMSAIFFEQLNIPKPTFLLNDTKTNIVLGKSPQTKVVRGEIKKQAKAQANNPWKISIDNIGLIF